MTWLWRHLRPTYGGYEVFFLHTGCKIDGQNGAASFALIASLAWQVSIKKREGLKKAPPTVGRRLTSIDSFEIHLDQKSITRIPEHAWLKRPWLKPKVSLPSAKVDGFHKNTINSLKQLSRDMKIMWQTLRAISIVLGHVERLPSWTILPRK